MVITLLNWKVTFASPSKRLSRLQKMITWMWAKKVMKMITCSNRWTVVDLLIGLVRTSGIPNLKCYHRGPRKVGNLLAKSDLQESSNPKANAVAQLKTSPSRKLFSCYSLFTKEIESKCYS